MVMITISKIAKTKHNESVSDKENNNENEDKDNDNEKNNSKMITKKINHNEHHTG